MSWLLMIAFGTIPFAAGIGSGRRAVAMAAGVVVVMGSFILTTFGQAVDWLQAYEQFSLLYYFPAIDAVKEGVDWVDMVVLASLTLLALIVALLAFRRRDIA